MRPLDPDKHSEVDHDVVGEDPRELEQPALEDVVRETQPPEPAARVEPPGPSAEEHVRHELTHAEFQPWCEFCVAGRGQHDSHRKTSSADKEPSGQDLGKAADLEARREEIRRLEGFEALEWVPEDQARGKRLIRSRWEDVEKFDPRKPKVRSRWVLQNFAASKAAELDSATPRLAATRLLEAVAVGAVARSGC
jgi:hypothetical protein